MLPRNRQLSTQRVLIPMNMCVKVHTMRQTENRIVTFTFNDMTTHVCYGPSQKHSAQHRIILGACGGWFFVYADAPWCVKTTLRLVVVAAGVHTAHNI